MHLLLVFQRCKLNNYGSLEGVTPASYSCIFSTQPTKGLLQLMTNDNTQNVFNILLSSVIQNFMRLPVEPSEQQPLSGSLPDDP